MLRSSVWIIAGTFTLASAAFADEIFVESVNLPGASLEQEITYYPTKADYVAARDSTLQRMKDGDNSAFVNPTEGPWMHVETTAMIGFEIKGVGTVSGRKNLRQISAAEEALFLYEKWKAEQ